MERETRIGLFGGTFDPPHRGHLAIAQAALEAFSLQQLILLPSGHPPHKDETLLSRPEKRLAMTRLLADLDPRFVLDTYDLDREGKSFSFETVLHFREKLGLKREQLYFLIGADSLQDLAGWREPKRLLESCRVVTAPRPGKKLFVPPALAEIAGPERSRELEAHFLNMPGVEISATAIRAAIRSGILPEAEPLLLPEVAAFIRTQGLFT